MVSRFIALTAAARCSNLASRRRYDATLQQLFRHGSISRRRQQTGFSSFTCAQVAMYSTTGIITHRPLLWNDQYATRENRTNMSSRRPVTSLLFGRAAKKKILFQHPWHDPEFMQHSSPEELETWLLSLVQSARKTADEKGIITNDHSPQNPIVYFDKDFKIDAIAYLRVLEAYARSKSGGSPQKAEYWIGVLERHHSAALELFHETYGNHVSKPNSSQPQRLEKVADIVRSREKSATIVRSLQPTVDCYNAIIELWGNDKDLISVVRSRRWLTKLEDEAKNANNNQSIVHSLGPNARSYDLYLHSCSRGLGKQHKLHVERAEEAEQLLHYRLSPDAAQLTIRPTTESFNFVLRGWTRCRKEASVAAKVMKLVLMMERYQKEVLLAEERGESDIDGEDWSWKRHVAPDTKTYSLAIDGWIIKAGLEAAKWRSRQLAINNTDRQRSSGRKGSEQQPDRNATTGTQDNNNGTKELEKAELILQYIQDLDTVGQADVRATVIGYNTLLAGWARLANELRPEVPLKAEKLLHDLIAKAEQGNENATPDVISFNAVIKAWGRTKRVNSADRCEYWLRKMINANRFQDQGETNFIPKPNVNTYNLCMDAHFVLGDAPRVQDMLIEMDATNGLISPNSESFSKVIRAWLDDELNKPYGLPGSSLENAWRWLDELLQREKQGGDDDLGAAPDLFHSILKTAARTNANGENILTIGQWTFRALKGSRFFVDHLAYTWLLEIALKVLSSPDQDKRREELITGVFEQCCKDGLLSSKFVRKISKGPFYEGWTKEEGERLCKELLGDPPFPPAWSRNLKNQKHHPFSDDVPKTTDESVEKENVPVSHCTDLPWWKLPDNV